MIRIAVTFTAICLLVTLGSRGSVTAQERTQPAGQRATSRSELQQKTWTVDGRERTALVYRPSTETPEQNPSTSKRPLIFGFHGHGGNARRMVKRYHFHELWPEAVVVYPQGLKTPGKTDPQGKKPGWQNAVGIEKDRDLAFFDAMLESLVEKHNIDPGRVYLSGHSNGAGFSYLLLIARNSKIAAIGVSAGGGRGLRNAKDYEARPVLHIAGRNDTVVPFTSQERTLQTLINLNDCENTPQNVLRNGRRYPSRNGTADVIFWPHNGTHAYPEKAPGLIINFLKRVSRQTRQKEDESARQPGDRPKIDEKTP